MPAGDRTGPMGMGPMTGRAAGYCAGYPVPGYLNPYGGRFAFGRAMWYPGAMGYSGPMGNPGGRYAPPAAAGGWPYASWEAYPLYARPFRSGRRFFAYGRGPGRGMRRW